MATAKKKAAKKSAKKSATKKGAKKKPYVIQTEERAAPPVLVKPKLTGDTLKSMVLRVDADFALAIRKEARDTGRNITAITRELYRGMYGKK